MFIFILFFQVIIQISFRLVRSHQLVLIRAALKLARAEAYLFQFEAHNIYLLILVFIILLEYYLNQISVFNFYFNYSLLYVSSIYFFIYYSFNYKTGFIYTGFYYSSYNKSTSFSFDSFAHYVLVFLYLSMRILLISLADLLLI